MNDGVSGTQQFPLKIADQVVDCGGTDHQYVPRTGRGENRRVWNLRRGLVLSLAFRRRLIARHRGRVADCSEDRQFGVETAKFDPRGNDCVDVFAFGVAPSWVEY